jgi:Na+/H+ antiporter NhaA
MGRQRRIERVQEWLYVVIVSGLTLYLVIGVVVWTWMIMSGVPAPDAFVTILAAITGALAGIVTPLQGPGARRQAAESGADQVGSGSKRG